MSQVLTGVPSELFSQVQARYIPLRDSRAFAEPERNQRQFWLATGALVGLGGALLILSLLLTGKTGAGGLILGLTLLGLGLFLRWLGHRPLTYLPPEPLENLASLSQSLGLCKELVRLFPNDTFDLDPVAGTLCGSSDGRDWSLKVDHQTLAIIAQTEDDYDSYAVIQDKDRSPATRRIWSRSHDAMHRHRVLWEVTIEGAYRPRPGQPSEQTSLDSADCTTERAVCIFSLPIISFTEPGLGHEGRTDFISSPAGLHHPEFVGEQIALSLAWLFPSRP